MTPQVSFVNYLVLAPEIGLLLLLVVILAYNAVIGDSDRRRVGLLTAWGAFLLLLMVVGLALFSEPFRSRLGYPDTGQIWGGMIVHGPAAILFRVMFLLALLLTALFSADTKALQKGEYYALLVMATIGFDMMALSGDLIMLFLSLETAGISLYLLAGYTTWEKRSAEAGIKYFVYGAFVTAIMLYGLSFLYGAIGSTNLFDIASAIGGTARQINLNLNSPLPSDALANTIRFASGFYALVLVSAVMVVAGFGFKISAVPFHFWAPDVYEGSPSPVTGFLSTASKAAGFALFFRVFDAGVFGWLSSPQDGIDRMAPASGWWAMLVSMCIVTVILGNLLAIYQTNIKRLLAYSSIAQAGYILIGLVSMTPDGASASLFYLLMYVFTNIAAFGVITLISNADGSDNLTDLSGLSRRSPGLALVMMIAFLSLGGIPPTAGFIGKFLIFKAAVDAGLWWLALIGVLAAFVSLYYYLSVLKYMYLYRNEERESTAIPVSRAAQVGLVFSSIGIIALGILVSPVLTWAQLSAAEFFARFGG